MRICITFAALLLLQACSTSSVVMQGDQDIATVKSILQRQAADWNRGDIDAFMEGYWRSDELQFIGSNGVTYGWENTLARYKRSYPDRAAMGTLHFDIIRTDQLSPEVIMLTGKYTLTRKDDMPTGHFLLVWRKIDGQWVIVADHTS